MSMSGAPSVEVPAAHLIGRVLDGGWQVTALAEDDGRHPDERFSYGYFVEGPGGQHAFLKALNFVPMLRPAARGNQSVTDRLYACVAAYRYERDLLCQCRDQRLSRVVRVIAHGECEVPDAGPLATVPYLILEPADGDVRQQLDVMRDLDLAWAFRALQHTATGLKQLHQAGATHQDLRPENVLTQQQGREMKLGDLGKAISTSLQAPHAAETIPGNRGFAPPEQLYHASGCISWEMRRAADLYQLGSLAAFLFTRHSMTGLLQAYVPPKLIWGRWNDTYEAVLPYVRDAFARAMEEVEGAVIARLCRPDLTERLIRMIRELCDPDPVRRGHPKDHAAIGSPYRLERYESQLNLLAKIAEMGRLGRT